MSGVSDLATADSVIAAAGGRPIDELYGLLRKGKAHDPAHVAVLHVRAALVRDANVIA